MVVHFHAGNGGQAGFLEGLLEEAVDLVLCGAGVHVFAEALFHYGRGDFTLTEAGQG